MHGSKSEHSIGPASCLVIRIYMVKNCFALYFDVENSEPPVFPAVHVKIQRDSVDSGSNNRDLVSACFIESTSST